MTLNEDVTVWKTFLVVVARLLFLNRVMPLFLISNCIDLAFGQFKLISFQQLGAP